MTTPVAKVNNIMSRPNCDDCARVRTLEAEVVKLRAKVEELTRAGKRQAAPFSKGAPTRKPKRPGRKKGKDYGTRGFRRRPRHVDEDHDVPLPERCTDPCCNGPVDEDGIAARLLESTLTHPPNVRLQKHLTNERDALFTFLHNDAVEATDWPGEHAMRPAVVNRKTSGGSRSDPGADAQGILTSLIRTARQQGRDTVELLVKLQRAPHPIDLGLARGRRGRSHILRLPCPEARASPA
jgi:hypothetical protein